MTAARVIVAGAGPVGLAAALLLDRLGYRIDLVSPRRAADERTSALLAGSVALLERLGVWRAVVGEAAPLRSLRIVDGTRRLIRAPEVLFHASEIGLDAFGYNVPNRALLAVLEAALASTGVRRIDAAVEDVIPGTSGIGARLSNGEEIDATLIVAADGRRSRVREAVGIAVNEWRYDQSALVVNLSHDRPHEDTSTEFHTEAGPFTLVPLPGQRSSLVWVDRPAATERRANLPAAELATETEERSAAILGAISIDGPAQTFPLAGMNATRLAGPRLLLVGEAAHLFPPIGAQGLNLGYRDVTALGQVLRGHHTDPGLPDLLAAYERSRRSDVASRTLAVDALNRTLLTDFIGMQGLRGLGLFLLDRLPALRRAVMRRGVDAA